MRKIIFTILSALGLALCLTASSTPSFAQNGTGVVVLYCTQVLDGVKVASISPPGVFSVSPGQGCADALSNIINWGGFYIKSIDTTTLNQTVYTLLNEVLVW
jgi:hypothetical protein